MPLRTIILAAAAAASLAACATPKVLVGQEFLGRSRTTKLIIQKSMEDRFDTYVRICNLLSTGEEQGCVDTLVLTDVTPGSVY